MATEVETPPTVDAVADQAETKPEEVAKPEENHVEEKQDDQAAADENKPTENEADAVAEAGESETKEESSPPPPPKVIIYQHPPWNFIPSPLPACIKIETYCRLMKIPYENVYKSGTDQKLPYLEYKGETKKHDLLGFLNSKFEVNADANLNDKDKACSRAFQIMAEENTFWSLMYYRWVDNFSETKKYFKGLDVVRKNVRPKLDQGKCVKCLEAHEIGKHNKEEIYAIGEKDLRAYSAFLEDKEFFMGSEPTTIDCTMFGLLSCLLHTAENSPLAKVIREELKNLVDFCDRMKLNYWLDWNDLGSEEQVEETRPKSRLSVKKKKRTKSTEPSGEAKETEGEAKENGEPSGEAKEGEGEATGEAKEAEGEAKEEEASGEAKKEEEPKEEAAGESAEAAPEPKEQAEEEKKEEEAAPVVNGDAE